MTEEISIDNNAAAIKFINETLSGVDSATVSEALGRVKEYAYKNEIIGGDAAFFLSARVLKAIEAIKREREDAKENKRKEQLKQQKEIQEEFKLDESPPPEAVDGILAQPSRVPTREELHNMLNVLDKNYKFLFEQINGLNDALDVIQVDMKILKDKILRFEDIINKAEASIDNKDVNATNNAKTD
jgi:hypothetical protein